MYDSLDLVVEDIDRIKEEYLTSGKGPQFPGYERILAESKSEVLVKASEYFCMSQTQNAALDARRLKERVNQLEKESRD